MKSGNWLFKRETEAEGIFGRRMRGPRVPEREWFDRRKRCLSTEGFVVAGGQKEV